MVLGELEFGVPDIWPVLLLKESPAGSEGEIVQLSAAPPLFLGVTAVIAVPAVAVIEVGLIEILGGAGKLTVNVTVLDCSDDDKPESVSVTIT